MAFPRTLPGSQRAWTLGILGVFGIAALVVAGELLSLGFGTIRSAPIDEANLVGVWVGDETGGVLEFEATGRVVLTDFVYLSAVRLERSPAQDAAGDWHLDRQSRLVIILLDEAIEGISGIGFDSLTCGSERCLRYGSEDGDALTYRRQK